MKATRRPLEVRVEGCPDPFARATSDTIRSWRWMPPRAEGRRVEATVHLTVPFRR